MSGVQNGAWVLVLIFATFLAIVFVVSPQSKRPLKASVKVLGGGILFMALGVGLACLSGKKCMDVLTLEDAGGFGRAYSAGLVFFLAGIVFGIKNIVNWSLGARKNREGKIT